MLLYKHKGDYLLQFYPQTTISVRDKLEFQHGGTPVPKREPDFNHKRTKCLVRAYNLLIVLPTIQLMREKKQSFYRRCLLRGNQHANHL